MVVEENAAPIDWISKLPDELLCYILSLLPTKLAFSTTVLSKRWTPLTRLLTALHFHDESVKDEAAFFRFCSFVDTVTVSAELIKTFHLTCESRCWRRGRHYSIRGTFIRWIQTLKQHPLENLHLYSTIVNFSQTIILPSKIFTFPTLVVLKLTKFHLDGNISVDLPLLKTLHLNDVYFKNQENFHKLLYGCPVLEDLIAHVFYSKPEESHNVNTGQSKTLSKLITADIYDTVVPYTAIYNVQILKLRVNMRLPAEEMYSDDRSFKNLICLELFLHGNNQNFEDLMELLQNCPKLQTLSIDKWKQDLYTLSGYTNSVPKCISDHLRSCTVKFDDTVVDLRIAKYILTNAPFLEDMTIVIFNAMVVMHALKDLASCSIISPKCKISILGQNSIPWV